MAERGSSYALSDRVPEFPAPRGKWAWEAVNVVKPITISGRLGDDAKLYQEQAVKRAIKESQP